MGSLGHEWLKKIHHPLQQRGTPMHSSVLRHTEPPCPLLSVAPPALQLQWGDPSMVDAERRLLAHAMLNPANMRFILLSES